MPDTPPLWKDRTLALATFAGGVGFLYQATEILKHHSAWRDFSTPAGVGELLFAVLCGLLAIGAATGLNVGALVSGLKKDGPE